MDFIDEEDDEMMTTIMMLMNCLMKLKNKTPMQQ